MIPKKNEYLLVQKNTSPQKVAEIMADVINELAKNDTLTNECCDALLAMSSTYPEFIYNLCNFAYQSAYFVPDPPTKQIIRTVHATLRDKSANCVDYTVFLGAIAKAAGLNVVVRIVQLPGHKNFGHVYPIVNNTPLDLTLPQDQTGKEREVRKEKNIGLFGVELPYLKKSDILVPNY